MHSGKLFLFCYIVKPSDLCYNVSNYNFNAQE